MSDDLVKIARDSFGGPTYVDTTMAEPRFLIHVLADEITRLRAELAAARCNDMGDAWIAQKHAWQEAVENALLQWCSAPSEDETPKDALRRLIQYEITAALDPAVSQSAADLVATARRDALAEIKQDTDELIEQGRQDGMEEAAQDLEGRAKMLRSYDPDSVGAHWALHYAAAIRAAAGEDREP